LFSVLTFSFLPTMVLLTGGEATGRH